MNYCWQRNYRLCRHSSSHVILVEFRWVQNAGSERDALRLNCAGCIVFWMASVDNTLHYWSHGGLWLVIWRHRSRVLVIPPQGCFILGRLAFHGCCGFFSRLHVHSIGKCAWTATKPSSSCGNFLKIFISSFSYRRFSSHFQRSQV